MKIPLFVIVIDKKCDSIHVIKNFSVHENIFLFLSFHYKPIKSMIDLARYFSGCFIINFFSFTTQEPINLEEIQRVLMLLSLTEKSYGARSHEKAVQNA